MAWAQRLASGSKYYRRPNMPDENLYRMHGGPAWNPGRLAKLVTFVAERIGYGRELPAGSGVGLATHFTFGGYTAHAIEVSVRDGRVPQSNFHDYPLARIAAFPSRFECHILPWDDVPTGVGEIGIPSAAPALSNAIFAATGRRIRDLPIGRQLV